MDITDTIITDIIITNESEEIKIISMTTLSPCQNRTTGIAKARPKLS